jgi:hypothetical protein
MVARRVWWDHVSYPSTRLHIIDLRNGLRADGCRAHVVPPADALALGDHPGRPPLARDPRSYVGNPSVATAGTDVDRCRESGPARHAQHPRKVGKVLLHYFRTVTFLVVLTMAAAIAAAADLDTYRQFTLGASTADTVSQARAMERDVKVQHARPALLQELSWRPPYRGVGDAAGAESVAGIVFSFFDNQLFRMTIGYEDSRTEGLTNADMVTALSATYGPPAARAGATAPRPAFDSLDLSTTIATWRRGDTTVELTHSAYRSSFGLVITSVPLEALARKARTTAEAMDVREAPAREAARAKAEADAARAAEVKTRMTNKETFTP